MIPTSRKDAIAQNSHVYFTGLACRNGHISKRYTQSGSCSECIHPTITKPQDGSSWLEQAKAESDRRAAEREAKQARQWAKRQLVVLKLAHLPGELMEVFSAAVFMCTVCRFPMLLPEDVKAVGSLSWRCHPEDKRPLGILSAQMIEKLHKSPDHQVFIENERRRIYGVAADVPTPGIPAECYESRPDDPDWKE